MAGIIGVALDEQQLEVLSSGEKRLARHAHPVHTMKCRWRLSSWHFGTTPTGLRDSVPVSVTYTHAGKPHVLDFHLQAKFYDGEKKKRRNRALQDGELFDRATTTYDAAKHASVRPWTFEKVKAM